MPDEMQGGQQAPAQEPAPPPAATPAKPEQPKAPHTVSPEQAKLMAVLCYFGLLLIIPLLIARDNEYVQFHLKQGIVWLVVWVIASFLFSIPWIGGLLGLGAFVVSVFAAVEAYQGKKWEMPLLGQYAKMIKL